jgi:hypothetical protein
MAVSIIRTITPEQRELDRKLKELKRLETDLAQQELDLATLRAEMRAIDLLYVRRVGARLAQLDLIEARIADLLARLNPDDQATERRAREARKQADETRQKEKTARAAPEGSTQFKPSKRLRGLYRDAAKSIHPDLASDDCDRDLRNQWMVQINEAYQAGDEESLAALLEKWMASPESVQGAGASADLERTIRKIARARERLKAIHTEIDRLRSSFAFNLRLRMRAAEKEGRDLLEEMSKKLDKKISRKQSLLDDLRKNSPPIVNGDW